MCPNCRAFISSDDRQCQYCGITLQSMAPARVVSSEGDGFIPEHAFTTFMLLLINGALFAISMMLSSQAGNPDSLRNIDIGTLILLGGKSSPRILQIGEWWRLVTAGFLHGGITHILMNGWALMALGRMTDAIYGSARYLVIFFAGTVGGFWLSTMFSPESTSVGASAGLAGLVGAMIALPSLSKSRVALDIRDRSLQTVALTALLGLLGPLFGMRVDNMAHLGGLVAGYVLARVVGLPMPVVPAKERLWTLAAWICVLLTVFSFFQMAMFFTKMHQAPLIPPPGRAPQVRELPRERL